MPPRTAKAGKKASVKNSGQLAKDDPLPIWPSLQPLVPAGHLAFDTILESQIVVIKNFFTSSLCKKYVAFLLDLPFTTTPAKPKSGDALRINDRLEYGDFGFAERLYKETGLSVLLEQASHLPEPGDSQARGDLSPWGGTVVGLNPRIRVYRYKDGQFFAPHYDESNTLDLPTSPPTPARTTWTLLIYLTGPSTGCIGGETVFYPGLGVAKQSSQKSHCDGEKIAVEPEVGMALLHKHGNDCLLHEGLRVSSGVKYLLRTDICVRR